MHDELNNVKIEFLGAVRMLAEENWSVGERFSAAQRHHAILYVWNGHGWLSANGKNIPLHLGEAYWLRPGEQLFAGHAHRDRLGLTFIEFRVLGPRGQALNAEPAPPSGRVVYNEREWLNETSDRIARLDLMRLPGWKASAEGLTAALALEVMRAAARAHREPKRMRGKQHERRYSMHDAARRLSALPGDAPRMKDLAGEFGTGLRHFSAEFTNEFGVAPQHFVTRARLRLAQWYLERSTMDIRYIHRVLGFKKPAEFTGWFRRNAGVTPRTWRQRSDTACGFKPKRLPPGTCDPPAPARERLPPIRWKQS